MKQVDTIVAHAPLDPKMVHEDHDYLVGYYTARGEVPHIVKSAHDLEQCRELINAYQSEQRNPAMLEPTKYYMLFLKASVTMIGTPLDGVVTA